MSITDPFSQLHMISYNVRHGSSSSGKREYFTDQQAMCRRLQVLLVQQGESGHEDHFLWKLFGKKKEDETISGLTAVKVYCLVVNEAGTFQWKPLRLTVNPPSFTFGETS